MAVDETMNPGMDEEERLEELAPLVLSIIKIFILLNMKSQEYLLKLLKQKF